MFNLQNWIVNSIFPGIENGIFVEITKGKDKDKDDFNTDSLKSKGWKIIKNNENKPTSLLLDNLDNIKKLEDFLILEKIPNFIHVLLINKCSIGNTMYKFPFLKYKFGVVIVKTKGVNKNKKRQLVNKTRKSFSKSSYKLYHSNKYYDYFLNKLGSSPYYVGQRIFNKYKIVKKLWSGVGSSIVFLVMDNYLTKYVVKKSINNTQYQQEKTNLMTLKTVDYVPDLIYCDDDSLFLVMSYCGNDLRNIPDKERLLHLDNINSMHNDIIDNFEIYHNDVRWKNISILDKKLYLIDWGLSDKINNELNHDGIIKSKNNYDFV